LWFKLLVSPCRMDARAVKPCRPSRQHTNAVCGTVSIAAVLSQGRKQMYAAVGMQPGCGILSSTRMHSQLPVAGWQSTWKQAPRLASGTERVAHVSTLAFQSQHCALAACASLVAAYRLWLPLRKGGRRVVRRATTVDAEIEIAPWEIAEETEEEKQARYKREAAEMKLKWDARRLEERQSAERRRAWAEKEKERARLYGPRDLIMEAYEARIYEEARVLEVRRRQREVYERIKAHKSGKPLPPKGEPYVNLRPVPVRPPPPEDFDVSGRYYPEDDVKERAYKAPAEFVSPSGERPPPANMRGRPLAAWEDPPYGPPPRNPIMTKNYPEPGDIPEGYEPAVKPVLPETSSPPQKPSSPPKQSSPPKPSSPPNPSPAPASATPTEDAFEWPSEAEIRQMKVAELKALLKSAGLGITGTKKVLQGRALEAAGPFYT